MFKIVSALLNKRCIDIEEVKKDLEKESKEKGISQEKAEHLQADIERLNNEKKELDKRIKELEAGESESKKVRDKELEELKTGNDNAVKCIGILLNGMKLENDYDEEAKEVYEEMLKKNEDDALLKEIWEKHQENKSKLAKLKLWEEKFKSPEEVQKEITTLQKELEKEQSWWDKWIGDETSKQNFSFVISEGIFSLNAYVNTKFCEIPLIDKIEISKEDEIILELARESLYKNSRNLNKIVRNIYEYYRDK